MNNFRRYCLIVIVLALLAFLKPVSAKETYPKLANYYLKYFQNISQSEYDQLMKWDLLIIPNEISSIKPGFIRDYKNARPSNMVLAYVYPAMSLTLPHTLFNQINNEDLWLKDKYGNELQIWPGLYAVNITNPRWREINLNFIGSKMSEASWDGIMYDTVDTNIERYSRDGIDIDRDGREDPSSVYNSRWQQGMVELFSQTRQRLGNDKIMMMNGDSISSYQPNMNGRIFEMFPTPWEGNGSWQATMYQYLRRLPSLNKRPVIYVLNGSTNNSGRYNDYRKVRFGLASALLGDGYFSFDFGDQKHEQLWWYDEYDVALGRAESSYYNLLDPANDYVRAGLWRRDFENGTAIVNSTNKDQLYIFKREQFEKIKGSQDRNFNDGSKINYIKLAPNDGIILKNIRQDVIGSVFPNGTFVRVFNSRGEQKRSGFFANRTDVSPNAPVLLDDLDGDGQRDRVTAQSGSFVITRAGRGAIRLQPYGAAFKGALSFAAYDFDKDGLKEIVVAPASGGGPHIKVYSLSGKTLYNFFAFDKAFHGGVNVAAGDVNNDGQAEIITAPAKNLPGTVKYFTPDGRLIGSFLAYDKKFQGGVTLAVGDIDADGKNELITGAASGGPHVRIFNYTGALKGQFMAYDPKSGTGITVMVNDIDADGTVEILAATASF